MLFMEVTFRVALMLMFKKALQHGKAVYRLDWTRYSKSFTSMLFQALISFVPAKFGLYGPVNRSSDSGCAEFTITLNSR